MSNPTPTPLLSAAPEEAWHIYNNAHLASPSDSYVKRIDEALTAVAREAEARLRARIAAMPVEVLTEAIYDAPDSVRAEAEAVRARLLAAIDADADAKETTK